MAAQHPRGHYVPVQAADNNVALDKTAPAQKFQKYADMPPEYVIITR